MGVFGDSAELQAQREARLAQEHGRTTAVICEQINSLLIPKFSHIIFLFKKTEKNGDTCWQCFKTSVQEMVAAIEEKTMVGWDEPTLAEAAFMLSLLNEQIKFVKNPKKKIMHAAWNAALTELKSSFKPLSLEAAQERLDAAKATEAAQAAAPPKPPVRRTPTRPRKNAAGNTNPAVQHAIKAEHSRAMAG